MSEFKRVSRYTADYSQRDCLDGEIIDNGMTLKVRWPDGTVTVEVVEVKSAILLARWPIFWLDTSGV